MYIIIHTFNVLFCGLSVLDVSQPFFSGGKWPLTKIETKVLNLLGNINS